MTMLRPLSLTEAQKIRQKIRRLNIRHDSDLDAGTRQLVKELRAFYKNYFSAVKDFLTTESRSIPEDVIKRTIRLQQIASQLDSLVESAGLDNVLNRYREQYAKAAAQSLEYFKLVGLKATKRGIDLQSLETVINFKVNELVRSVDDRLVQPLRSRLVSNVVGTKGSVQIIDEIRQQIDSGAILRRDGKDFTDRNVETLVDDSIQRFRRRVIQDKAASLGMELVEYRGPNDAVTRPACKEMLTNAFHGAPGIYYTDEVTTALHKDLQEDPLVSGGGWNCRHNFWPVTLEYAKAFGFIDSRGIKEEIPSQEIAG